MTDFSKILNKAKELESKMKESQKKIKNISVTGISGGDAIKVTLNGEGELINLDISSQVLKEDKVIIEDLIKAEELEAKMKESQEKIKNIQVQGISGANSVQVTLNGDGEMIKLEISPETIKEEKSIIEDLIVAAHNNAKIQLKTKTSEEISKATGGLGIPGFKWPI